MPPTGCRIFRNRYRQTEVKKLESNLEKLGEINAMKYVDMETMKYSKPN